MFHVELRVPSTTLLKARDPEPPNPRVVAKWTDIDFNRELERCAAINRAYAELLEQCIHPALRCILGCERLNDLLEQCGTDAIIRISLERPPAMAKTA